MPLYTPSLPLTGGTLTGGIAGVLGTAADLLLAGRATGDTQDRLTVAADGKFSWGPGDGGVDTYLYRAGALTLKTDGAFVAPISMASAAFVSLTNSGPYVDASGTAIMVRNRTAAGNVPLLVQGMSGQTGDLQNWRDYGATVLAAISASGQLLFGSTGDTNLYRSAAARLATESRVDVLRNASGYSLVVNNPHATGSGLAITLAGATLTPLSLWVTGDSVARWSALADGKLQWGPGSGAVDTTLYRSAADTLKTDDNFVAAGNVTIANPAGNSSVLINAAATFDSYIYWRIAGVDKWSDKVLADGKRYITDQVNGRNQVALTPGASAAAALTTIDSRLTVNEACTVGGTLTTVGTALMQSTLTVGRSTVQGGIAAHVVAPDANTYPLVVQGIAGQATDLVRIWNSAGMQVAVTSAGVLQLNAGMTFGTDTNLYRSAADTLKTDDSLYVGTNASNQVRIESGVVRMQDALDSGRSLLVQATKVSIGQSNSDAYDANNTGLLSVGASGDGTELVRFRSYSNKGYLKVQQSTPDTLTIDITQNNVPSVRFANNGYINLGSTAAPAARLSFVAGTTAADGILFGADTNLYRSAADTLRTDDTFVVSAGQSLWAPVVNIDHSTPKLSFNVTGVTERAYIQYLPATPALRIDSDENIQLAPANITAITIDASGRLLFGTAVDTNLFRYAADTLKTDDAFIVGDLLTVLGNAQIQGVLYANSHTAVGGNLAIAGNIGFYGSASVAKPAVTGSRGGNAALASLLTALASQGLITDSSTA